jgi:hypothetical protein
MVKGQMAAQDERLSETCLHREIDGVVQKDVTAQEKADPVALAANLEEAGTWYYVVDCARCKAVVPFKYAPEGEPIVCFPTMNVRCFQCNTDHTYTAELISHRKAAAPPGIFNGDRQPSHASDGNPEAFQAGQEDRGVGDSGGRVILDREIDSISASLRCNNILNVAVSGKRATIFFLSSCFFAAGWVSRLALHIFYSVPPAALDKLRSFGPETLLETAYSGTVLLGLLLFIFGMGSFFVETRGFKRKVDEFLLILKISGRQNSCTRTAVPQKDRSDGIRVFDRHRIEAHRPPPPAATPRTVSSNAFTASSSGCLQSPHTESDAILGRQSD